MTTDNVAVAVNVIQAVTSTGTNIVNYSTIVHEPIISGAQGPQGIKGDVGVAALVTLPDVDIGGLVDGGLLIYNMSRGVWEVSKNLQKVAVDCGQY